MSIDTLQTAATEVRNPLRAGLDLERTPSPCALVIFGGSGDLVQRKLLPALWALHEAQQLPPGFSMVGVSRSEFSHDQFRQQLRESVLDDEPNVNTAMLDNFLQGLFYVPGSADDAQTFERLGELLAEFDRERGTAGNRIF